MLTHDICALIIKKEVFLLAKWRTPLSTGRPLYSTIAHHIFFSNLYNNLPKPIVESARSIPYGGHTFARNYVLSAHYIALIRAI
jgi:hypothetical protein